MDEPDFKWFSRFIDEHVGAWLTFMRRASTDEVFTVLGVDSAEARVATWSDAGGSERLRVRAGSTAGWGFGMGDLDWRRDFEELVVRASHTNDEAFCLSFTATISGFFYANSRGVVSGFDLTVPHIRWGTAPDRFAADIEAAGFLSEISDPPAMSARLVRIAFGVTIDPDLLTGPLPTVMIDPP